MTGAPRRLRVLHAIQNLNYGGMEKLLADLVRRVNRDRFESHVLTLEYRGRYSREMEGYATVHLGPRMSRWSLVWPRALARCLRELRPDVVHTHSGVWYKVARAARLAGVPRVIHTEHGRQAETLLARLLDRRAARLSDVIVAVSHPLRDYLLARLGVSADRLTVVINGVDTDVYRPRPAGGALRRELGLSPTRAIIGSIGRLEAVKGYDVVIEAFAMLRAAGTEPPMLVLAGEGAERELLAARARALGVERDVALLGWRDDTLDLYAEFSCFVLGSWSEGTSVALLEAMACGLPPVVTAVGGNPDVLGPELTGQMVPAGDAAALARLLAASIEPAARASLSAAARRRVEQAFGLGAMIRGYEALYGDSGAPSRSRTAS